ncbi:M23 family metallopeptidase [Mucilaginibacter lappiensis]|uniref:Murein DD-endopeptidase MepM/ murein hydrolase activator NlpD n=1 Tax=Mucilaginibacter lappiensis TaxID=354630 RepID=A0A841JMK9_9SPHI|nr:M23 family metallopeptidase [Mucilaginibacter lappiensis]MBB6131502.1 murein DD-endopeptidase MepM/ murein hydrolase activator NlpD [Mucilaginibacter lappiensis]
MLLNLTELRAQEGYTVISPVFRKPIAIVLSEPVRMPKKQHKDSLVYFSKVAAVADKRSQLQEAMQALPPCLPLKNLNLRSGYGPRTHPVTGEKNKFHSGVDLSARSDSIYCVLTGFVSEIGYNSLIGIYCRVQHGDYIIIYGHLSKLLVQAGDSTAPGTVLGISGATGRVTGEHLHFSVKYKGEFINPLHFLYAIMTQDANQNVAMLKN